MIGQSNFDANSKVTWGAMPRAIVSGVGVATRYDKLTAAEQRRTPEPDR